jgi:hypothetical protein
MCPSRPPHGSRPNDDGNGRDRPPAADDRRGGRRPPPEATGQEADYLFELRAKAVPVRVVLKDGSVVHGVVEYYDRDLIKIQRPHGPHLQLRKLDVRLLEEDVAEE